MSYELGFPPISLSPHLPIPPLSPKVTELVEVLPLSPKVTELVEVLPISPKVTELVEVLPLSPSPPLPITPSSNADVCYKQNPGFC